MLVVLLLCFLFCSVFISPAMAYRAPLVIEATGKHTASVLILHGLGDSGHGWGSLFQGMKSLLPHVKWILPHAPSMPVTLNGGHRMPAWYDIYALNDKSREDEEGVLKSSAYGSAFQLPFLSRRPTLILFFF